MSNNGVRVLEERLCNVINYCRLEYDLTYADYIGVLEMIKMDMYCESTMEDIDGEIEDDDQEGL